MFYKCTFAENYSEVDFLRPNFDVKTLPSTRNQQRGIPTAKKDGIIKLMHVVKTPSKLKFWIDLPVNDGVSDLSDSIE
jgi:hypothetical protein